MTPRKKFTCGSPSIIERGDTVKAQGGVRGVVVDRDADSVKVKTRKGRCYWVALDKIADLSKGVEYVTR